MAFEITNTAKNLAEFTEVQPNLIMEIEGIEGVFSAGQVSKLIEVGDDCWFVGKPGIVVGGICTDDDARDLISLDGTTTSIGQQLFQDKGGSSSITRATIKLVDKDQSITKLFEPSNVIGDILAAKCKLYLGFSNGAHPRDSINIFNGLISDVKYGAGFVSLAISHPKELERQVKFQQATSILDGAIDNSTTTILLESTRNLITPTDTIRSFIRVDDELIEYTGISGNNLTGVTRGALLTLPNPHDDEVETVSFYQLEDHPIDMALKLLLSNGGVPTKNMTDLVVESFNLVDPFTTVQNAILFDTPDIQNDLNIITGDFVTVTGAANAANNFVNKRVTGFGIAGNMSYIIVEGSDLISESTTSALTNIVSQYNVYPVGASCGLRPDEVDITQFLFVKNTFAALFPDYKFYLKEEITVKDFIDNQIFFPSTLYSLPRAGKVSVGITIPPLANINTRFLTSLNVKDPEKMVIERSINRRLYNAVVYKLDEDVLEDKFLRGEITVDNNSQNRLPIGNRPLVIEAKGLRQDDDTINFVLRNTQRFLDRYRFGAAAINVKLLYKTGYNMEVGDTVVFGDTNLQVSDDSNGSWDFSPRIMEVTDKNLNFKTGDISLKLTDTAYNVEGRFAVISPSSQIAATGSTTSTIKIVKGYGSSEFDLERVKWEDHVGQRVAISNCTDPSQPEEITFLTGFDVSNPNNFQVSPPLSFVPDENWNINIPQYPISTDPKIDAVYKVMYGHLDPSVAVVSGASTTVFDVAVGDIPKFFIGSVLNIHNDDFTDNSADVKVTDITATTITVDNDIGFTPDSTHTVELVGFPDLGKPYRIL